MLISLNGLSEDEIIKFDKFVNSPFFNSRKILVSFFNYLRSKYPDIEEKDIDKSILFEKIYPGEKYNDVKLRKLTSDFIDLYESFLVNIEIHKIDPFYSKSILLEVLQNRGLKNRFERKYNEIIKEFNKSFNKDGNYYRNYARIELFSGFNNYHNNDGDKIKLSMQTCSDNLDLNFVFSKLHIFREMAIQQKLSSRKLNFNKTLFDEIINYVRSRSSYIKAGHPNIYIIYLTLLSMVENDRNKLTELIDYIQSHKKQFSKEKLNYYYQYVISEMWRILNEGDMSPKEKILELYDEMIKQKFFKIEKYVSHIWINNAVNIAVMNGRYEWGQDLLKKFKGDIDPDYVESVINLSMARISFGKADYVSSLKYLQNLEFSDTYYYVNAKILTCRILFEQGDLDQMNFIIDSLKHYSLRNKKLLEIQKSIIKMAVKYFNWLLKLKIKQPDDIMNMKKSLDSEKSNVPAKDWFYEKIYELNKDNLSFNN